MLRGKSLQGYAGAEKFADECWTQQVRKGINNSPRLLLTPFATTGGSHHCFRYTPSTVPAWKTDGKVITTQSVQA